mmetsp:Transcript_12434/g.25277  ORF Transcript_12434/g.25277 Transcript_12434/m.25277 type:complete len:122 (+) Transcript_12434:495-860(+)
MLRPAAAAAVMVVAKKEAWVVLCWCLRLATRRCALLLRLAPPPVFPTIKEPPPPLAVMLAVPSPPLVLLLRLWLRGRLRGRGRRCCWLSPLREPDWELECCDSSGEVVGWWSGSKLEHPLS